MEQTIDPLTTMDAKLWADEFMATKARLGDKEFDHAMMLAWFANAIMVGYDEGQRRKDADAQATIAALQARVQELEEITKVICGHCCEPMEIPSKAVLQSQLTQRTAELEAAKAERSKALESQQNMLQSMANWLAQLKPTHHPSYRKGVEEVIAAAFNGYRADKGQPVLLSEWQEQQIRLATLQAELERVRGERA